MRARARDLAMVWVTLSVAACTDFEPREKVVDLRVLAITAEPPEVFVTVPEAQTLTRQVFSYSVVEDPAPVRIEVLAVNPRDPDTPVVWSAEACIVTDRRRCESGDGLRVPVVEARTSRLDEIAFDFSPTAEQVTAWVAEDPFFGFGGVFVMLDVEIEQAGEPRLHASKIVTYDVPYVPVDDAAGASPEKTPNENPPLHGLRVAGRDSVQADEVIAVGAGEEVELEPLFIRATAIERYVEPTFSNEGDLGWTELEEKLEFDYYATAGSFDEASVESRTPVGDVEDLTNTWTAPAEADEPVTMWVVVRDDRGGASWLRRLFRVVK